MANRHWLGVDGNWNNTANWSTTDGGTGGETVPGASDDVYINRGSLPISTNIGTPTNATVANLYIREGFGGDTVGKVYIGDTAGVALVIAVTGTLQIDNRRASFFRFNGAIGKLEVLSLGTGAQVLVIGGSVTTALFPSDKGYFEFSDDVELTYCDTDGCRGLIKGDSTSAVALELNVGKSASVECWRRVEIGIILGTLVMAEAAEAQSGSRILVGPGGTLDLRQSGGLAGTSAGYTKVMSGGRLTARNARLPFTIARLVRHSRATIELPALVTVTSTDFSGKAQEGILVS